MVLAKPIPLIDDLLSEIILIVHSSIAQCAGKDGHTWRRAFIIGKAFGHAAVVLVAFAKFLGTHVCSILASASVAAVGPFIACAVASTRERMWAASPAGFRNSPR